MVNKYLNRQSASLVTKQNYKEIPSHPLRWTVTSVVQEMEKLKLLYITGGNVKSHSLFGKWSGSASKCQTVTGFSNDTPRYVPKRNEIYVHIRTCT